MIFATATAAAKQGQCPRGARAQPLMKRSGTSEQTFPRTLAPEGLYKFWGIVKNHTSLLYRINGMEEHVHLFIDLHPSIALSDFIQKVKTSSSLWLKQNPNFPRFQGWAGGYAALTYSWRDKDMIINYIINQREHHKKVSFIDEYRASLLDAGVKIDERYFP